MTDVFFNMQFQFLRPWLLLLLSLPIIYYVRLVKNTASFSDWRKAVDEKLLPYLLIKNPGGAQKLNHFLFLSGLIFGIIAAAGPAYKEANHKILTTQNPVMILLNLSGDMEQTDISPTRLSRAKIEINDFLNTVPDIESGLIVYSSEPFVISPLSNDFRLIQNLLKAVDFDIMPANGDRPERAMELAAERMRAAGFSQGNIVLFTAEGGVNVDLSIKTSEKIAAEGFKISVIGFSAKAANDLKQIAKAGKGQYFYYNANAVQHIADFINKNRSNELNESRNSTEEWQDCGYYLMFFTILSFLFLFRKGLFIVLIFLAIYTDAYAGFWWRDKYEARNLFADEKYEEAAQKFEDNLWRGAALYKQGNFEQAVNAFSQVEGPEALYNKGNALAKSGKIEEAVKTYETVLEQIPEHEDAKFNLEYLKQQQQNQQNRQQQQNQDENQDDNRDEQNQSSGVESQQENGEEEQNQQDSENSDNENNQNEQNNDNSQDNEKDSTNAQNQIEQEKSAEAEENQQQEQQMVQVSEGDEDDKYDEQIQAREQRFRNIPDDNGGLLRAFIRKEYNKNRYGE